MNKTLRALVAATLLASSPAWAVNLVLEGDHIRIGINETAGTLGSGGNTSPGILYKSDASAAFNTSYDYLTPGTPYEGWSLFYNGSTRVHNNNAYTTDLSGGVLTGYNGTSHAGVTFDNRAVWTNTSHSDFDITHDYRFNDNQQYVDIVTSVTAKTAMTDLYFGRFTDPDARAASGDSSATDNVLGYGAIPTTQVVFSEAIASRYALGLYSAATNVKAGVTSPWSNYGDVYYQGTTPYGTGVNFGRGDHAIGLGFYLPTLASGATATYQYAYIFGPSAFAAADVAVDSGAGGGTPGTVPGCTTSCTLADVGSATSAASSSSAPTVTGTSTVNTVTSSISYGTWTPIAVPTTYAYSSSYADPTVDLNSLRQIVSRDNTTTTTVTDKQTRTVTTTTTTTPVTTTTYSDSSTVVTSGTPTSTSTSAAETVTIVTPTSASVAQTASAPIDTYTNAVHLNLFNSDLNAPNPLNRIDLTGTTIQHRNTNNVKQVSNNSWAWVNAKTARGNASRGNSFEVGFEKLVNETTLVGAQFNISNNNLTKVESGSGKFDNYMINAYAVKKLGNWAIRPMIGYEKGNYKTSRTIALTGVEHFEDVVYYNSMTTSSKAFTADLQVIAPRLGDYLTPYAGIGVKHLSTPDVTESGSSVTALPWSAASTNIIKPYIGARVDSKETDRGVFFSVDSRVTKFNNFKDLNDGYNKYGTMLLNVDTQVGYKFNPKAQAWVGYQHQQASGYDNNVINAGVKIDF